MRKTYQSLVIVGVCLLVAVGCLRGDQPAWHRPASVQTVFRVDTPADGQTVFGIVQVKGFILDPRGVSMITLLVDGVPVHDVDIDQPRDDVRRKYPRVPRRAVPVRPRLHHVVPRHQLHERRAHDRDRGHLQRDSTVETLGAAHGDRRQRRTTRRRSAPSTARVTRRSTASRTSSPASTRSPGGRSTTPASARWPCRSAATRTSSRRSPAAMGRDIEVMVDGRVVGQAIYSLPRPDVSNVYPDVAGVAQVGLADEPEHDQLRERPHTISPCGCGTPRHEPGDRVPPLWIDNNYATLRAVRPHRLADEQRAPVLQLVQVRRSADRLAAAARTTRPTTSTGCPAGSSTRTTTRASRASSTSSCCSTG